MTNRTWKPLLRHVALLLLVVVIPLASSAPKTSLPSASRLNRWLPETAKSSSGEDWLPSGQSDRNMLREFSEDEIDYMRRLVTFAHDVDRTLIGSVISTSGSRRYPAALGNIVARLQSFDFDTLAELILRADPLLSAVAADFRRNAALPSNDRRRRYSESVMPTLAWPWIPANYTSNCSKDYSRFVEPVTNRIWGIVRENLCSLVPPLLCNGPNPPIPVVPQLEQTDWGRRMIDAMGKIPEGISEGTLYWIGSWDLCVDLEVQYNYTTAATTEAREFEGLYCRLNLVPSYSGLKNVTNATLSLPIQLGVCVPNTCDKNSVHRYVTEENKLLKAVLYILDQMTIPIIYCGQEVDKETDGAYQAAIGIMLTLFILTVIGTIYDGCFRKWRLRHYLDRLSEQTELPAEEHPHTLESQPNGHFGSSATSTQDPNNDKGPNDDRISSYELVELAKEKIRFVDRLDILAVGFSAYSNLRKIFTSRAKPGDVSVLNGIRYLSFCWMIMGQTYFLGPVYNESNVTVNTLAALLRLPRLFKFQFIINFPVCGDSFLFISGFLVTYRFLKSNPNLEKLRRPLVLLWTIFKYILCRYWRYMPVMMLGLMFHTCLYRYLATGPNFPVNVNDADNCRENWWVNMLLMHNLVRTSNLCQSWMFLVSLIFQLQLAAAILVLVPLVINKKFGYVMIAASWVAHIITTGILTYDYRTNDFGKMATGYLFAPWCRAGPFNIGMAFGIILYHKKKINMHWLVILICWIVSFGTLMAVVFSSYDEFKEGGGRWSVSAHVAYDTLARSAWAVALGWIVLACNYGYGGVVYPFLGWKFFLPLSRLVYASTVTHASMIFRPLYTGKSLLYIEEYHMMYLMFGHVIYTMMVIGIAWSLMWHYPLSMGVEKFLFVRTKAEWLRFGRHPQTAKRPVRVFQPVKPFSGQTPTFTPIDDGLTFTPFESLKVETTGIEAGDKYDGDQQESCKNNAE